MPYGTHRGRAVIAVTLRDQAGAQDAIAEIDAMWCSGLHGVFVERAPWGARWVDRFMREAGRRWRVQALHDLEQDHWPGGNYHWILDATTLCLASTTAERAAQLVLQSPMPVVADLVVIDPDVRKPQRLDAVYRAVEPSGPGHLVVPEPAPAMILHCSTPWAVVGGGP